MCALCRGSRARLSERNLVPDLLRDRPRLLGVMALLWSSEAVLARQEEKGRIERPFPELQDSTFQLTFFARPSGASRLLQSAFYPQESDCVSFLRVCGLLPRLPSWRHRFQRATHALAAVELFHDRSGQVCQELPHFLLVDLWQ